MHVSRLCLTQCRGGSGPAVGSVVGEEVGGGAEVGEDVGSGPGAGGVVTGGGAGELEGVGIGVGGGVPGAGAGPCLHQGAGQCPSLPLSWQYFAYPVFLHQELTAQSVSCEQVAPVSAA